MFHHFQVRALDPGIAASYFELDDQQLAQLGACRMTVDAKPGFPCRVSLQDAELGEEVLLFTYGHHDVVSPYRSAGPIFVRRNAPAARLAVDALPPHLAHRFLSLRGYNRAAMLVDACTAAGADLETALQSMLDHTDIHYIHLHNAAQGCFHCQVDRV